MSGLPTTTDYQVVPTTEAPAQQITVTLGGQACVIMLYTKSINVPAQDPNEIPSDPNPRYENVNPVFCDLYIDNGATLIVGGVRVMNGRLIVIDTYLGFSGDLVVYDTSGAGEDPYGVPPRLPPLDLRNSAQVAAYPLSVGNVAPPSVSGRMPGMGSRFILTYWSPGTYTPGYSLPL